MGASGAGKTSLLNAISQRITIREGATLYGDVKMNDKIIDKDEFSKWSAYVMQDDILFADFTVFQALMFVARLKLHYLSRELQQKKVIEMIDKLGLDSCKNTKIGHSDGVGQKGISGGERKRTSIAG